MIEGHGDDGYKYGKKVLHNFSSNVYYKGCDARLKSTIQNSIDTIENYPSPMASELNLAAANFFNLASDNFLFGNGATELFYLIAQCFTGKSATIIAPTFSEYQDACEMHKVSVSLIKWESMMTHNYETELVFICNPNNPTGQIISTDQIEILLQNNPETLFVIDEAYVDFSDKICSSIDLLSNYKNLMIVKSLTKTFAIPGIRLGYLVSNATVVKSLIAYKQPWTINSLAIVAGVYIFKYYKELLFSSTELMIKTEKFRNQVNKIPFLEVQKTHTNYFLVKLLKSTASMLKDYLMEHHQILVRDATNFKLIDGEFIRISVQTETSNHVLLKALQKWS